MKYDSYSILLKNEKIIISQSLFQQWRSCETAHALTAIIGIVLATLHYEYNYSPNRNSTNCLQSDLDTQLYLIANVLTTFISLWFLVMRHLLKSEWEKSIMEEEKFLKLVITLTKKMTYVPKKGLELFKSSRLIEIIILLIIPIPYIDWHIYIPLRYNYQTIWTCYTYNEIAYFFMFSRFMFLIRALANYTPYENYIARRYCQQNRVSPNLRFSFKCMLKRSPIFRTVTFLAIPSLFMLAQMLRIFERPLDEITGKDFQNPLNALWLIFASMSSAGYGDFFPISFFGRTAVVFAYIIAAFSLSIIIVRFGRSVSLNDKQHQAFVSILITTTAARAIQAGFKYFISKRKRGRGHPESLQLYIKFKERILDFQGKKDELNQISGKNDQNLKDVRQLSKSLDNEVNRLIRQADHLSRIVCNMKRNSL